MEFSCNVCLKRESRRIGIYRSMDIWEADRRNPFSEARQIVTALNTPVQSLFHARILSGLRREGPVLHYYPICDDCVNALNRTWNFPNNVFHFELDTINMVSYTIQGDLDPPADDIDSPTSSTNIPVSRINIPGLECHRCGQSHELELCFRDYGTYDISLIRSLIPPSLRWWNVNDSGGIAAVNTNLRKQLLCNDCVRALCGFMGLTDSMTPLFLLSSLEELDTLIGNVGPVGVDKRGYRRIIGLGNGIRRNWAGRIILTGGCRIEPGSVRIYWTTPDETRVPMERVIHDGDNSYTRRLSGYTDEGISDNWIDYNNGTYEFSFRSEPPSGSAVQVDFTFVPPSSDLNITGQGSWSFTNQDGSHSQVDLGQVTANFGPSHHDVLSPDFYTGLQSNPDEFDMRRWSLDELERYWYSIRVRDDLDKNHSEFVKKLLEIAKKKKAKRNEGRTSLKIDGRVKRILDLSDENSEGENEEKEE